MNSYSAKASTNKYNRMWAKMVVVMHSSESDSLTLTVMNRVVHSKDAFS